MCEEITKGNFCISAAAEPACKHGSPGRHTTEVGGGKCSLLGVLASAEPVYKHRSPGRHTAEMGGRKCSSLGVLALPLIVLFDLDYVDV